MIAEAWAPVKYPYRSTRRTSAPALAAETAADRPAGPPPPTKTSFLAMIGISRAFSKYTFRFIERVFFHSCLLWLSRCFLKLSAIFFGIQDYLHQKKRSPRISQLLVIQGLPGKQPCHQRISTRRSILSTSPLLHKIRQEQGNLWKDYQKKCMAYIRNYERDYSTENYRQGNIFGHSIGHIYSHTDRRTNSP